MRFWETCSSLKNEAGKITTKLLKQFSIVLLAILVTGRGGKAWTVAEVIQKAERLDGKTIRLRGLANFGITPSQAQMWMEGVAR